jgi:hypothetical protein
VVLPARFVSVEEPLWAWPDAGFCSVDELCWVEDPLGCEAPPLCWAAAPEELRSAPGAGGFFISVEGADPDWATAKPALAISAAASP